MFRRKNKAEEDTNRVHDGTDNADGGKKKSSKFYQRFAQQELWGWSPIITGNVVVIYFLAVAIICIALGVPILLASIRVKEVKARYDNIDIMSGRSNTEAENLLMQPGGVQYPITMQIPTDMQPPVYVYYELGKYYQNHKRYVRSRDDNQMAGKGTGSGKCAPEQYVGGNPNPALPHNGAITPCGLIAWSFFNDSFGDAASLVGPGGAATPVTLDQSDVAWEYDVEHLYGPVQPVNYNTEQLAAQRGGNTSGTVLNKNEHLIVWMRPAAQPTFRKLWAVIDTPLPAGTTLTFNITNQYNTYRFGGQKALVISTNSWMGGKNMFLGVCYLVIAGIALLVSIGFLTTYHLGCFGLVKRRKFGDVSQLSWNRS